MSVHVAPFYSVRCDFPLCTSDSGDDSDYSAWSDAQQAYDVVSDSEWLVIESGGDYCPEHTVETDEEDADGEPARVPARDTFEFALESAAKRVARDADRQFDYLIRRLQMATYDERRQIQREADRYNKLLEFTR